MRKCPELDWLVEFIPGQIDQPAAVVVLDHELVLPRGAAAAEERAVRGESLVIELGHVGTDWATPQPRIHVELCEERPQSKRWQDRERYIHDHQ